MTKQKEILTDSAPMELSPMLVAGVGAAVKTLHLTLKKKWFDMILSGEKKEEYREIKEYWCNRFCSKEWYKYEVEILHNAIDLFPDEIVFKHGYSKNAPTIRIECKGITIGKGVSEWGGTVEDVFIIKLGKILETKNVWWL